MSWSIVIFVPVCFLPNLSVREKLISFNKVVLLTHGILKVFFVCYLKFLAHWAPRNALNQTFSISQTRQACNQPVKPLLFKQKLEAIWKRFQKFKLNFYQITISRMKVCRFYLVRAFDFLKEWKMLIKRYHCKGLVSQTVFRENLTYCI